MTMPPSSSLEARLRDSDHGTPLEHLNDGAFITHRYDDGKVV